MHDLKENAEYDRMRTYVLKDSGIQVIRFRNEEVGREVEMVLNKIRAACRR